MSDDPAYLDPARSINERVDDLLGRMTLAEKAGQMFHTIALFSEELPVTAPAEFIGKPALSEMIHERHMTHFNVLGTGSGKALASWHNQLQELALNTRLKIPVTLSSDPRHGAGVNVGTGEATAAFSSWPEALGLAALGDVELVERFAEIVRRELLAIGVRTALHPQLDVATEPRWFRTWGTFGDDAGLVGQLGAAYVRGLHGGDRLGPHSVSAMIKHFPGNGPVENGEDPHFASGKRQLYPGDNFAAHLEPFRVALAAGATQVMPSYGMPIGTGYEEVGCGFNVDLIDGVLRRDLGFDGIVCTDWGLISDGSFLGEPMTARAWGVEHLTPVERVAKALAAGVDQFGGEHCSELVVELVERGTINESRIDESVRRVLRPKFELGLFEQRHVDVDAAAELLSDPESRAAGVAAQSNSVTVLTNTEPVDAGRPVLPLTEGAKVHVIDIDPDVASGYGEVVDQQADAEVTIARLKAPYEPRPGAFESMFHTGSLDFPPDQLDSILATLRAGPTVVDMFMERPGILTPLVDDAAAMVVTYGCSDEALLDALFGRTPPAGHLPVALPRSMEAVTASDTDVPLAGDATLFEHGHGLDIGSGS